MEKHNLKSSSVLNGNRGFDGGSLNRDSSKDVRKYVRIGSRLKAETHYKTPDYLLSFEFPYNPDSLARGNNYNIYDEMRHDDAVKASLSLKKNFILCNGWEIECDNPEIKEELENEINNINVDEPLDTTFNDILRDILSSYDYGFSLAEPVYTLKNNKFSYRTVKVRPPHSFTFELDDRGNVLFVVQSTVEEGEKKLDPRIFLHHVYQPEFGNPYGISDLKAAYKAWKAKIFVDKFLGIYLERFAGPTAVGRAERNLSPSETTEFLNVIKSVQNATSLIIPKDTQIEFIQTSRDSSDAYLKALDYYNMRISRSLLVPDLVGVGGSDTQGGSFALGKKHFDIFLQNISFDRKSLERKINQKLIKQWLMINYGDKYECTFRLKPPSNDDIIEYSKVWSEAVRGNLYKPTDEEINHFRNILGFPEGEIERQEPIAQIPRPQMPENGDNEEEEQDDDRIGEPTELIPQSSFAQGVSRETTAYERKINFTEIKRALDFTDEKIKPNLVLDAKEIYEDYIDQIRKKGLLRRFVPEKIKELEPRHQMKMNRTLKQEYSDLFKTAQKQAKFELSGKKELADDSFLPEELLQLLAAESFKIVGDYSTSMTTKAKNILFDAIKSGMGESEIVKLLRQELENETDKWLGTVVRTKTTEIFNMARKNYWDTDKFAQELIVAYQYSAILDTRTSDICRSLDQKVYDKKSVDIQRVTPPLHFNCRSLLVPITRFEEYKATKIPALDAIQNKGGNLKKF